MTGVQTCALPICEFEGSTYLVMEYLEGITLKEVKKPLRVEMAVRLIRPIAEALNTSMIMGYCIATSSHRIS